MGNRDKTPKFYVSRQNYYYSGEHVVEITSGGADYAGADMYTPHYDGEGCEYEDPREAVKTAIEIRDSWKADRPDLEISIAAGCTGGMGLELEPQEDDEALIAWAEVRYQKLPKCDRCGKVLPEEHYVVEDEKFCSEYCAKEAVAALFPEEEESEEELEEV
jgi:hypothetical protein